MVIPALLQKTRPPHLHPAIDPTNAAQKKLEMLPVARISPNPAQPRRKFERDALLRLADSIRQYGVLQPLVVRAGGADYELISGERRLRAAKMLGMLEVPCILLDATDEMSAELAIIENFQRKGLDMFEEAAAIASLIAVHGLTQDQAARALSCSQSHIANKLRILRLTDDEREIILSENLTERHARTLLRIDDIEKRTDALKYIAARRMNVAAAEEYVDRLLSGKNELCECKAAVAVRKFALGDVGFFYNSLDHAVELARNAGMEISVQRSDSSSGTDIRIHIDRGGRCP